MFGRTCFGLVVLVASVYADAKPKLTLQEAEQKLADYWVEVEIKSAGQVLDNSQHFGWSFVYEDQKGPYCWLRNGEAVLSDCSGIGIEKVLDDGTFHIKINGFPGLLKFDGHAAIVVMPQEAGTHAWLNTYLRLSDAQIKGMGRPKDFTSTKANGYVVRVLKRTNGLYGTEPRAEPPAPPKK